MSNKDTEAQGTDPDGEEPMSPSERRGETRHLACFPAHLETAKGVPRSALIRDLSVTGALLLTRARVAVGDTVKLSLYLREGLEPVATTARVVREERRPGEMVHPWTKAVAVQFEAPLGEVEEEARSLADRQAALRGAVTGHTHPSEPPEPPVTMGETPKPPARPVPPR